MPAIRQIMQNLNNPATYLAYAAGDFVGISLENKLALAHQSIWQKRK